jgi:guanylate kinase
LSDTSKPCIILLTAPSGSGKTSVARRLLEQIPGLHFSVSATTRPERDTETDGVDYHFLTIEEFREAQRSGSLIESEEVYPGRFYGTLRSEVEESSIERPVLLDIDVDGAGNIKQQFPDRSFAIFIRPPSLQVLETRLQNRGSEDDESLAQRLRRARLELSKADRFDAVVVNDDLGVAVDEAVRLVKLFLSELGD